MRLCELPQRDDVRRAETWPKQSRPTFAWVHDAADDEPAAIRRAAHDYEAALVSGDTASAAGWFCDAEPVSRFGPEGQQLGVAAVVGLRQSTEPMPEPTWLHDEVRMLGSDAALHLAVLDRGGFHIQRTQVWQRGASGWRISHAHVSRLAGVTS